jgi:hypothetical protein
MPATDQSGLSSLGQIAGGLASDVQDLVRGELALARAEIDQKVDGFITAGVSIIGGALVAFAGLVVLLEAVAAVLTFWLPAWASLLIVGAIIVLVGGLISRAALARLSLKKLTPERTVASLRSDARIIKEHV